MKVLCCTVCFITRETTNRVIFPSSLLHVPLTGNILTTATINKRPVTDNNTIIEYIQAMIAQW